MSKISEIEWAGGAGLTDLDAQGIEPAKMLAAEAAERLDSIDDPSGQLAPTAVKVALIETLLEEIGSKLQDFEWLIRDARRAGKETDHV